MKNCAAGVGGESARVRIDTRAAGSGCASGNMHKDVGASTRCRPLRTKNHRVALVQYRQRDGDGLARNHVGGRRQAAFRIGQAQQIGGRLGIAGHQPQQVAQFGGSVA